MQLHFAKIALTLTFILFTAFSFAADCQVGGVGSTSCTIQVKVIILGQEVESTVTITCGSGYYSCCNNNGIEEGNASCIPNRRGNPSPPGEEGTPPPPFGN